MKLVVDANELFAGIIAKGKKLQSWTRDILFSDEFLDKIPEAKELAPHLKDVEYFALALKLDCPIWAQEKAFKKQSKVKVFYTSDLVSFL